MRRRAAGFTLIELMLVVAIAALVIQLVVINIGAFLRVKSMNSAGQQLISQLDFIRSEARLQGKDYRIELDLDNHRYRTVLPPEQRLLSSEVEKEELKTSWTPLGENVAFLSHSIAGGPTARSGLAPIAFDPHGFTADQTIYLVHTADEDMVWSIQLRGLTGVSTMVTNFRGQLNPIETVDEGAF